MKMISFLIDRIFLWPKGREEFLKQIKITEQKELKTSTLKLIYIHWEPPSSAQIHHKIRENFKTHIIGKGLISRVLKEFFKSEKQTKNGQRH